MAWFALASAADNRVGFSVHHDVLSGGATATIYNGDRDTVRYGFSADGQALGPIFTAFKNATAAGVSTVEDPHNVLAVAVRADHIRVVAVNLSSQSRRIVLPSTMTLPAPVHTVSTDVATVINGAATGPNAADDQRRGNAVDRRDAGAVLGDRDRLTAQRVDSVRADAVEQQRRREGEHHEPHRAFWLAGQRRRCHHQHQRDRDDQNEIDSDPWATPVQGEHDLSVRIPSHWHQARSEMFPERSPAHPCLVPRRPGNTPRRPAGPYGFPHQSVRSGRRRA